MTTVLAVEANEGLLPLLPPERWAARQFPAAEELPPRPTDEGVKQDSGQMGPRSSERRCCGCKLAWPLASWSSSPSCSRRWTRPPLCDGHLAAASNLCLAWRRHRSMC